MKKLVFIIACLGLALVFVLARSYYQWNQAEAVGFLAEENASLFVRSYAPTLGSEDARVYVVEFLDPACEACAAFAPIVKQLMSEHPGKIRLVVRYAPFHQGADQVVQVLEASRNQGKYWETLDLVFRSQPQWASHHDPRPEMLWQYLPMVGLDLARLREDRNDPEIADRIRQDMDDAEILGVRKTPSFFVNGKPLQIFGARQLKDLIESEIRVSYPE